MSDPRGTPRASKTAALVMLLVFFQVLVVALFGLRTIVLDRKEGHRATVRRADQDARSELKRRLDLVGREIDKALSDAEKNRTFDGLERLRDGFHGHVDLIDTVYQVDPETRIVYWMDGVHHLYVPFEPPDVREDMIRREEETDGQYAGLEYNLRNTLDGRRRVGFLLDLMREFPFWLNRDGYPMTVGYARLAIEEVRELVEFIGDDELEESYVLLEHVLLSALEVVFLNEGRKDIPPGDREYLIHRRREVEAATAALPPERIGIQRHVEAYQAARRQLTEETEGRSSFRSVLETVVKKEGTERGVTLQGDHLIGVVPTPPEEGGRHLVVRLNLAAARHLVEQPPDATDDLLERLGVVYVVRGADEVSVGDDETVIAAESLLGTRGLPFRVELRRIRDPHVAVGGPAELFYWGIIVLAAGGLGIGVWVLGRLYTREVRLARLKADFVSNLSHELKTPLTSIAIFTEMLQDGKLETEEDRQEGLSILSQESERLQSIVARMLNVAKRESRSVPYNLQPGDLNDIVRGATTRFARIVMAEGMELAVDLHPEPLPIRMDGAAIDDIVTNLLSNAWKYRRGDEARIQVRTARRGRRAEVVVIDDGVGIPRAERRKVFEMFYRVDALLTRSVAGTGLGLALVRNAVRAHKGSVRVEQGENGVGTLFRLRFPLRSRKMPVSPEAPSSDESTSPKPEAQVAP